MSQEAENPSRDELLGRQPTPNDVDLLINVLQAIPDGLSPDQALVIEAFNDGKLDASKAYDYLGGFRLELKSRNQAIGMAATNMLMSGSVATHCQ